MNAERAYSIATRLKVVPPSIQVLILGLAMNPLASTKAELLGFYPFDNPENPLVDASGGGRDLLSADADPVYSPEGGFEGGAYEFDGSQRWLAPIDINPEVAPNLTMGAWVKTSTLEAGQYKVMGHDNGGWDRVIGLDSRDFDAALVEDLFRYTSFVGNGAPVFETPGPESVDDWTFLAATYDQEFTEVLVYVDIDASSTGDSLEVMSEFTGFGAGLSQLAIGGISPANATEGWVGFIDNAFVFNETLTEDQLESIRNQGPQAIIDLADFKAPSERLIGFYPFDNSEDPTIDESGRGNDLVSASADPVYDAAGGVEGGAYVFDGSHRWVAPLDINPSAIPNISFGAWVKPSSIEPGLRKIMGHDDGGWDRVIGLDDRGDGDFRYSAFVGNGPPAAGLVGPANTEDWSFFATVYEQETSQLSLYLDLDAATREDVPQVAIVDAPMGSSTFDTLGIGSLRPSETLEGWEGAMDNVFVYDTALKPGQILRLRNDGTEAFFDRDDPNFVWPDQELFGNIGQSPDEEVFDTIELTNFGETQDLELFFIEFTGPDADRFDFDIAEDFIEPGASETLELVFEVPEERIKAVYRATLVIETNDPTTPFFEREIVVRHPRGRDGLIAFYSFDDAGNPLLDESENGADLASTDASPVHNPIGGLEGGGFEFDGSQWLIAPVDINPGTYPQLTMGAWVKTASLEPGLRKFMGHDNGGWDRTIGLDTRESGEFRYTSFVGDGPPLEGTPGPDSADSWSFIAAVYDQTAGEMTLVADINAGSQGDPLVAVTGPTGFASGAGSVGIGSLTPAGPSEGWVGSMDNVFFFNRALDLSELSEIRDEGKEALLPPQPIPEDALIGFYSFDDPDDPFADDSGSGADLESADADPTYDEEGGIRGGAYAFDGSQRLIAPIDINPSFEPQLTLGAWVKTSNIDSGLRKIAGHDNGAWDRVIGLDNRDGPFRYTSFTGTGPGPVGTPGPVNVDHWTFIAASYNQDAEQMTVFVDLDSATVGDSLVAATTAGVHGDGFDTFSIGNLRPDNANEGWEGMIDNVFVFNRALTGEQLTRIRNSGSPIPGEGPDPDLVVTGFPVLSGLNAQDSIPIPIQLSNNGANEPLQISELVLSGPDSDLYTIASSPNSIDPGGAAVLEIVLNTSGQVGQFVAALEILSDDPEQGSIQLDLSVGVNPRDPLDPQLNVLTTDPFAILGSVVEDTSLQIQLRNSGAAETLNIVEATLSGPDAGLFEFVTVPSSIAPGASDSLSVSLTPAGDPGPYNAVITLLSNDASDRVTLIPLNGRFPSVDDITTILSAFYPFDDPEDPLADIAGSGLDLSESLGSPSFVEDGGFEGGAFEFDGSQSLEAPIDINVEAIPELTIGAWVKATDVSSGLRKFLGHDDGAWDRTLGVDNRQGSFGYTSFVGNGGPLPGLPGPVDTETWSFVTAVYDNPSATVSLFVDADASTTDDDIVGASGPTGFNTGHPTFSIGSIAPGSVSEGWVGSIDNVFLFEGLLTRAQVQGIRNGGMDAILNGVVIEPPPTGSIRIVSFGYEGGFLFSWQSEADSTYAVEYRATLADAWTEVATAVADGPETSYSETDAGRLAAPTGFYRVVLQ